MGWNSDERREIKRKKVDVLAHWGAIEADFQREYRINIAKEIRAMSWRRFKVLLSGLSVNSVWANIIQNEKKVITDPLEAERAVSSVWK